MFTLHNGDCLQIMPSIPSGSIDAIITDLPYGTTACEWDSIIPLAPMWEQVKRVLKPNGVFITTASQPFTSILVCSNLEWLKHECIWDKVNHANFLLAKIEPLEIHESILVFGAEKITYNPQMQKNAMSLFGKRTVSKSEHHGEAKDNGNNGMGYPKSILRYPKPNNLSNGGLHPTQKSLDLYRYLIRTYTNEGETVLDIAMGSGTTIEAAEIEGRNSIGIEKEIGYFQIAEKRAKSAVLQQRLFTPSNNRLHMDAGDSPRLPSQSTLEGFTPAEQGSTPAPRQ